MIETLRNAWKIEELRKKILYTIMIIFIFRIGANIPVPFMDPAALQEMIQNQAGSMFGYLDILTGGAFSSATLFAMSISPYITASIVVQLLTVAIPALEQLAKEGEAGRKKLSKITRYTTLGLALLQSIAYYLMNRNQLGTVKYYSGFEGWFSAIVIIMSFTAGALLIVWLGEQIDKKGIGNGISMILFAGIVSRGRSTIGLLGQYLEYAKEGYTQFYFYVPALVVVFLILITLIVLMTNAERRVPVQYAKRVVGRKMYGGQSSFIPVKVMMSGVMPIIFASALLSIPGMIKGFIDIDAERFIGKFLALFEGTSPVYALLYFLLIIGFNYFYVAIQYNPLEMANNLRKNNGAIPGIRPGKPTSDFISKVINRITLVGAIFLGGIAVLPILLGAVSGMTGISLGGTSVIILVSVSLDTVKQLESQMMMRHYKGFLE